MVVLYLDSAVPESRAGSRKSQEPLLESFISYAFLFCGCAAARNGGQIAHSRSHARGGTLMRARYAARRHHALVRGARPGELPHRIPQRRESAPRRVSEPSLRTGTMRTAVSGAPHLVAPRPQPSPPGTPARPPSGPGRGEPLHRSTLFLLNFSDLRRGSSAGQAAPAPPGGPFLTRSLRVFPPPAATLSPFGASPHRGRCEQEGGGHRPKALADSQPGRKCHHQ